MRKGRLRSMGINRIAIAAMIAVLAAVAAIAAFTIPEPATNGPVTGPPEPSEAAFEVGRVIPIDVFGLKRLMEADPNLVIVDVRTPAERSGPLGYIPRSLHIPEKTVLGHPERLPRGKTLVFICHSGPRSIKAARTAATSGVSSYYVKGGMVAWRRMQHANDKKTPPASSSPGSPEETTEPEPFLGRDMGC